MTNTNAFPQEIKIHPLVGLKSFRLPEASGAWRLFVLAKNLAGVADHIERDKLGKWSNELGIKLPTFTRWMTTARNLGLFTDVQRMSGEWILILPSYQRAADMLGVGKLGAMCQLPAKVLFRKGWKGFVFASWQAAFTKNGTRLVSQKKQAEITGIDPQTQRQFNKMAGVTSEINYAISNQHANNFAGEQEYGNRAALFTYWDKLTHQKKLGWRIPDRRVFPLYGTDLSKSTPRKLSLFNRTAEQFSATMKQIRKLKSEDKPITAKDIYQLDRKSEKGNNLWIHCAI